MKKYFLTLPLLAFSALFMMGADYKPQVVVKEVPKKKCVGYTIIEAGKGLDCNGDTLTLVKRGGFYELASR